MRRCALYTLAASVLAVPACELVMLTTILDDTQYIPPVEGKLAISEDGNQIWVNRDHPSGGLELVAFANPSGTELSAVSPFLGSVEITDLAAAHEPGKADSVWTLRENGMRLRFDAAGTFNGFGSPANIQSAFPEGDRQWCGLVMGMDGAAYVMAGHQESSYTHWHLYREKDGIVTRTEGPFASAGCPEIAYDLALDEVAVAVDGGTTTEREVFWFDPDTMDETHAIEIVAKPQAIAVFNHKVAVGTSGFVRVWNPDGSVADTAWGVSVEDLDVQYGNNVVRLWWSGAGPDYISTVGWYLLG